jgi:hypothetical protein
VIAQRLITVVTALIAASVTGLVLMAATDTTDPEPETAPSLNVRSGLLVSNRSQFQVCVQTAHPNDDVRRALLAGLDRVRREPRWNTGYRDVRYDESAVLQWGCPAPRLPARYDRAAIAGPGVTADPSPYRIWIYLLDRATAERLLGSGPAGVATAELMRDHAPDPNARDGGSLFPVSTALLIRESDVTRPDVVTAALRDAAGLAPIR